MAAMLFIGRERESIFFLSIDIFYPISLLFFVLK